ncbi:MAG: NAD(P)-dependent oxidoreductase [Spirochaetes bacterium]|nr:MAG: NAD(P)-dependent oxidoreductase [Spirochaetota bacterium]
MLFKELRELEIRSKKINIGMSGSGWMARGFIRQVKYVPGMDVKLLVSSDPVKAKNILLETVMDERKILLSDNPEKATGWIESGGYVVTADYEMLGSVEIIDIVTDVTPWPESGIEAAYHAIKNGKDVVIVNIEADVTAGRILKKMADEKGVLYSVSSGDEPGCLAELWDFVQTLGYTPVVIGKGKNNPLSPEANPDTVKESAMKSKKDPYQVASYVDGTKTMFEMACAANATGCRPMRRGMIGPKANLKNVSKIFALIEDNGISTHTHAVDFVQGEEMSGGVFITVKIEDQVIQNDLEYLKVGIGKYFTFFRPYHLWFLEAPLSFARAYLYKKPTLVPVNKPSAEVLTVAKKDLKPGDTLDTFGGYTFYGLIDTYENYQKEKALPVGIAPGAKLKNPVQKNQIIHWDDVELDEKNIAVKLRRKQEESEMS